MCSGVRKSGSPRMREITFRPCACTSRTSARMALTAVGRNVAIRSKVLREYQLALSKQDIPTPALLLDLDLFEINLKRMQDEATRAGKRLRPHAKAHKCVEIAKRQIAAGAHGLCVATVAEAELMSNAGIE